MIKLLFFNILLTSTFVFAQPVTIQKPIECVDTETLLRGLAGSNYKEKPVWFGIETGVTLPKYSLFVNEETKSWTLIQFDEKLACIIGIGEASTQMFNGPKT